MRALVFDGQELKLDNRVDDPVLNEGEALIRPTITGICSTDLELCRGYMGFKGILGHEFAGIVEKVHPSTGDKGKTWIGKRVVGDINCVCQACDMCKSGLRTHCRNRTVLGIDKRNGCFAEQFTLPLINLLEIPNHVSDEQAVFTEPVAAGCNVKRQLHIEGKPYITILGDGRLGLLTAQVLAKLNASVRVVGKHETKMSLCEKWGIKHRHINEITPRADQDVVVDCTGSADGLNTAMKLLRPRGKLVMKTTVANQSGVDLSPIVINEIQIIGSRCGNFNDALPLIAGDEIDVVSLISRRVRFDQAIEAFRTAQQPGMIKVLLEMA